jgi:hypothetical protein
MRINMGSVVVASEVVVVAHGNLRGVLWCLKKCLYAPLLIKFFSFLIQNKNLNKCVYY